MRIPTMRAIADTPNNMIKVFVFSFVLRIIFFTKYSVERLSSSLNSLKRL